MVTMIPYGSRASKGIPMALAVAEGALAFKWEELFTLSNVRFGVVSSIAATV